MASLVTAPALKAPEAPAVPVAPGDQLVPLRGPALRIAENMTASLSMPVATSQRVMPVKVIDENRRIINQHLSLSGRSKTTLRALIDRLRSTYAGKMGVQYMHIENPEERVWLQQRMEPSANQWPLDPSTRKRILKDIIEAEGFELFLDTRFKGHKRFSIEGGESTLAMMIKLLERGAAGGCGNASSACRTAGD